MKFNFKLNLKVSAFYLEKQKSFIPKKIFLSRCQFQNKTALFTVSIFPKVLVFPSIFHNVYLPLAHRALQIPQ